MNLATCYEQGKCVLKHGGGCTFLSRGYEGRACPWRWDGVPKEKPAKPKKKPWIPFEKLWKWAKGAR